MTGGKEITYASAYPAGTGPVRLKVTIGEGQFGSSLVQLGEVVFPQARTFDDLLGTGVELIGKRLQIFSVVTDTNRQTNRTSVTYRIEGGPQVLEHTLEFTVASERDSIDFKADIVFVGPT